MIASMPPMGVVQVKIYDTPTEYKLAGLWAHEKRKTTVWRNRVTVLLILNVIMFVDIMYLVYGG